MRLRVSAFNQYSTTRESVTRRKSAPWNETGLSQRGLQQAFARAELPPPIAALRQARLEAVQSALLYADPTLTTVGEIATAWGFGHLGRFSGYYEAAFGEFPRATLYRSA